MAKQRRSRPAGNNKPSSAPKRYTATIYPGAAGKIPSGLATGILRLQETLGGIPVLAIIHGYNQNVNLGDELWHQLIRHQDELPRGQKIALVIDSPGGNARSAFRIARFLLKRCNSFVAVVPRSAKSAATLVTLGAEKIILGPYSELGPLDPQLFDKDREEMGSVLEHAQALERLDAFALRATDAAMRMLLPRAEIKVAKLLPLAMQFASRLVTPLMQNIDVIKYVEMSRLLKVSEEYARRLLEKHHDSSKAAEIASSLVSNYPEHGFPIDIDEAKGIGLHVIDATDEQAAIFNSMLEDLDDDSLVVVGQIKGV